MSEQDPKDIVADAAQRARGAMAETAERVMDTAREAGDRAQTFAREAGRQASVAAETLLGQGNDMRGVVERAVVENPWPALLIAGAIGYGMACLVKRR